jgi:hypothetical protein
MTIIYSSDRLTLLVRRFATAARAHQEALETLDEERAAAQVRLISGLFAAIIREGEGGQVALLALTDSDDPVAVGMAAVFALRLDPERCLAVLRRLSAEEGLLGFRAGIAVERWEKGEWHD